MRNQFTAKEMIWNPNHKDTAFTMPLVDRLMRRSMPGTDWRGWSALLQCFEKFPSTLKLIKQEGVIAVT